MFDSAYPVRYAMHSHMPGVPPFIEHILTFRCRFNRQYIIRVEEYEHLVFGVKFHLKDHRDSAKRYNLLTGLDDAPRVLSTVIHAMNFFKEKHPMASFVFFGAELEGESTANTKRFRIYMPIMKNFFGSDLYDHRLLLKESFYAMINIEHRDQNDALVPYIVETFKQVVGKPDE